MRNIYKRMQYIKINTWINVYTWMSSRLRPRWDAKFFQSALEPTGVPSTNLAIMCKILHPVWRHPASFFILNRSPLTSQLGRYLVTSGGPSTLRRASSSGFGLRTLSNVIKTKFMFRYVWNMCLPYIKSIFQVETLLSLEPVLRIRLDYN